MADVRAFKCIRPNENVANRVAALPYDVYSRAEAKVEVVKEPLSFLKIDRAETQFDDHVDTYDERVYEKAKDTLNSMIENGIFIEEKEECYFIYELIMNGRSQTGIVACASIDDYLNNIIKKHENTRVEKELDRIRHVEICNAQTGPIFLAYQTNERIQNITNEVKKTKKIYGFSAKDGVIHNVWAVRDKNQIEVIKSCFQTMNHIYIADGHHRAASAVKVGLKRRLEHPDFNGDEEFNSFLSVLFPEDQLMIQPYNRVVKDLNGYRKEEFLTKLEKYFLIESLGMNPYAPNEKGTFGMFLREGWFKLTIKEEFTNSKDPVSSLDVSLLQNFLLDPILGIKDPSKDKRIDFIGGIRGLAELETRVKNDMAVAFSMYPTSLSELFAVSDANKLMPPKSTWFEPKLRSGLFIHKI